MEPADLNVDSFAWWHVVSGDIDPVYPVLTWLLNDLNLDEDDAVGFVLLYVAYYDIASALRAWLEGWRPGKTLTDEQMRYRTGVERRAHRDVRQFAAHIDSLNRNMLAGFGPAAWLDPTAESPARRWYAIQRRLDAVHGNGRWAGYKTGEILDTVLDLNCPPPNAGHANSSGPRKGLADIFPGCDPGGNTEAVVAQLDRLTDELVARWSLPVAQVETILCDWHSTVNGGYYLGHDIDLLLQSALRVDHPATTALLIRARHAMFDRRWLGEHNGWDGVRPKLKRLYADFGVLSWWDS